MAIFAILLAVAVNAQTGLKKVYNEDIDPLEQINQAVVKAKAEGKFVICQVGGNWCPWCLRFADFAKKDSVIAPLIEQNYVYIHVNYSKGNKNLKAMRFLGNPGRFGYPVFVILDSEGKPIHTQESESLEEGKGYSRQKVEKFLRLWTRQAVEAEVK
jgi:uncharacterized protein YyaL (SSP411 family)